MKKSLIRQSDGLVVNVIEIEDGAEWQPPIGCVLIDALDASPGDIWDGTKFVKLPPSPEEIIAEKRREAHNRAVQTIKDNAGTSPWGKILNDIAIAQGWIQPI